ncbi:MAG: hypothetical protein K6G90_03585, partial [Clostridia bacterium]|nr:hypothetical protein [Clostridia bacterium]
DFSYNQYGGYVYVNVTNGDALDSNGSVNLAGGTLEVYAPSQGDGDPIDTEMGCTFGGATVLAVGHAMMQQSYKAATPYVTFSGRTNLVTAGKTITIKDQSGNTLYTGTAVRAASYVLFSSSALSANSSYTLYNGSSSAATAAATTNTSGSNNGGPGGNQSGNNGGSQSENNGGSASGKTSVFQTIIEWFRMIINWFKNLFSF